MKKTIAGTLLSVSALVGLAACSVPEEATTSAESEETTTAPGTGGQPPETEEAPEVQLSDTDGVFSYEISVRGEQDYVTDSFGDTMYPSEDHFFVVDVTATNQTNAPTTAPDPMVYEHVIGVDAEGRTHSADDEVWTDMLDANPGGSVTYTVAWDLPEGVEIEYVELAAYEAPEVAVLEAR